MSGMSRSVFRTLAPKAIINGHSAGGGKLDSISLQPASAYFAFNKITSGALTANTLATQINVVGAGVISFLRLQREDSTAAITIRCKVTIDGVVVFDATSAPTLGASGEGMPIVGLSGVATSAGGQTIVVEMDQMTFYQSLKVEVCSSVTETAKLTTISTYRTS